MKKVGITGGIGSGKTVVARILETMGYPVYYSDLQAKELTDSDPLIREGLIRLAGPEVYVNGILDREYLARVIFQDDILREKVNQLIHPRVRAHFSEWCAEQKGPIVFNEAAILFETGGYTMLDRMILVVAPLEKRINRVMLRDGISREQVLDRISKQWDDERKIPLADFVVINDDQTPLLHQVEDTLASLLA